MLSFPFSSGKNDFIFSKVLQYCANFSSNISIYFPPVDDTHPDFITSFTYSILKYESPLLLTEEVA